MSQPAHLRVILSDHVVQKLTLPSGIPGTVAELHSVVRDTFRISGDFCLHYKDADFGNDFFSLLLTTDITDKDTIKVVYIQEPPTVTLTLTDLDGSCSSIIDGYLQPSDDACSSVSSHDTLPVSPGLRVGPRNLQSPVSLPVQRFCFSQAMKTSVVQGLFSVPKISSHYFQIFLED